MAGHKAGLRRARIGEHHERRLPVGLPTHATVGVQQTHARKHYRLAGVETPSLDALSAQIGVVETAGILGGEADAQIADEATVVVAHRPLYAELPT